MLSVYVYLYVVPFECSLQVLEVAAVHSGPALGSGSFGVVLEAELGGKPVVVKVPRNGEDFGRNCDWLEDEVDVLRHLQSLYPRGAHKHLTYACVHAYICPLDIFVDRFIEPVMSHAVSDC